jgi:RNA polymerase sigma factor (sigma-70 family)
MVLAESQLRAGWVAPATGAGVTTDWQTAVAAAYLANMCPVTRYLGLLVRDTEVGKDLAHEAFLRLAEEARAGRFPTHPKRWLFRVGANLAATRGRRLQLSAKVAPRLAADEIVLSPESDAVRREEALLIAAAVATLSSKDQEILILAASGYATAEIADLKGMTDGAVRTRLCRSRANLRMHLEREAAG